MKILAYDVAETNFGITLIEVNPININLLKEVHNDVQNMLKTKQISLLMLKDLNKKLTLVLNSCFELKWYNVIDLDIKKAKPEIKASKLKQLLSDIDLTHPNVDRILIEYQMKQNDKTRLIASQIMYHYSGDEHSGNGEYKCKLNNTLKTSKLSAKSIVSYVNPVLKNEYKIDKDGDYRNFISCYSNYVANKKHTVFNFSCYMKLVSREDELNKIKKYVKLDDVADAFMMTYGWWRKQVR